MNPRGERQRLQLKTVRQVNGSAKKALLLPLPVGAAFAFPVDLDDYWSVRSKDSEYPLKPGTYSLFAEFRGFAETNVRGPFSAQRFMPVRAGLVRPLDVTYLRADGIPTSNKVKFEVSGR